MVYNKNHFSHVFFIEMKKNAIKKNMLQKFNKKDSVALNNMWAQVKATHMKHLNVPFHSK